MRYYISFDGGGSKLQGVLFDSEYRIRSTAKAGGVNRFVHTAQESEENIRQCVRELLQKAGAPVPEIEALYTSQGDDYIREVRRFVPCNRTVDCGEGPLGLLTSGLTSGICALSGTGSDIFYVKDGRILDILGGWGYVLGDLGSGFWIGRQAVCSMFHYVEGTREATLLHRKIGEEHGIHNKDELFRAIYGKTSPAYYIASFCKTVGHAAQQGDPESVALLEEAGETLAGRVCQMVEKHGLPADTPVCTAGSVFRYCGAMRRRFERELKTRLPKACIRHPMFEPVIGGILFCMMENGEALSRERVQAMKENYDPFSITEGGITIC